MRRALAIVSFVVAGVVAGALAPHIAAAQQAAKADSPPTFQPEPFWPKPLPEGWILGQVAGIAVSPDDHIWIIHRPATLLDDEKGLEKNPPEYKCCKAAPAVMEFDTDGNLLRHSAGPGTGHEWGTNEHGIQPDNHRPSSLPP